MMKLPHINSRAPLTETDLGFLTDTNSYEIQSRTKALADFGIISNVSPLLTSSPLQLKVSNTKDIVVTPGSAITTNGNIVESKVDTYLNVPTLDEEYTVFIEYELIGTDNKLTRYNTYEPSLIQRAEEAIKSIRTSEYDVNTVLLEQGELNSPVKIDSSSNMSRTERYSLERKESIVKLGTVIKSSDGVQSTVIINLEGSDLRPWFSPKDIVHRSKTGSGLVTDNNPHGIAVSDLTVGNLTLFDMVQGEGFIVSKDYMFPHFPGKEIKIQVAFNVAAFGIQFKPTSNPKQKQNGTYSINVKPYKIGNICVDGQPEIQFPFDYNFETGNLFIYGLNGQWNKYIITCYVVDCLTPLSPTEMMINGIKVLPPTQHEAVITSGIARNTINNDTVLFDGNIVPMDFTCYLNKEGNVISNPAIAGKFNLSGVDVDTKQEFNVEGFDTSKIGISIKTYESPDFAIEITGITDSGVEDTDTIIIASNNVTPVLSTKLFTSITSWKIIENPDTTNTTVPTNAQIVMYAFRNWESRGDYAEICVVSHPGSDGGIITYKDTRNIGFSFNKINKNTMYLPPSDSLVLLTETSSDLKYVNTSESFKFNGAKSTYGVYKTRMLYLPSSESKVLSIFIEEKYNNSISYIKWCEYTNPSTLYQEHYITLDSNGAIKQGSINLSEYQYGYLEIQGSFDIFTLLYA